MPFPIDKDIIAIMEANGVQATWAAYSGNPSSLDPKLQSPTMVCTLVDALGGEKVAEAKGNGKVDSLNAAIDILRKSPRLQPKDRLASLQGEIETLRAKLAEVREQPAGKKQSPAATA